MKSNLKVSLLVCALASLSAFASGCGSKKTTTGVTIVSYQGNRGYYSGATFCYWGNNYCNSGKAYGITYPAIIFYENYYGYYYNDAFCDFTNDYCGTDLSWGIADDGTTWNNTGYPGSNGSSNGTSNGTSNGGYSPGSSSGGASNGSSSGGTSSSGGVSSSGGTSSSSGGSVSGGSTSGGSYSGGSTSGGSTSGGSTSGGSTSGGSYSGGSYSGGSYSGGSYSGGSNGGSGGSNGYSVSIGAGPALAGECTSVDGCVAAAGNIQVPSSLLGATSADAFSSAQSGIANSIDTDTKDVDLQRAELQGAALDNQAQSIAGQFGMSFDSAKQLAQLADKMSTLSSSGQITEEQRETITHAALDIAGLSTDDVNAAIASTLNGDSSAIDSLMNKAATNLGMQSSAGLRDQLLPTLGINF